MENKYDKAISEAFLKSAFEQAAAEDIAELEALDIEVPEPSAKQRREIERRIRAIGKKGGVVSTLKRIAAAICIVISVSFALLMLKDEVRASVMDAVVAFFDKYVVIAFSGEQNNVDYRIGEYTITYMPKEYEFDSSDENPIRIKVAFKKAKLETIVYLYNTPFNKTSADNESTEVEYITLGNDNGYFADYNDAGASKLVWGNEAYTFTIKSPLPKEEILKIAKNIIKN